MLHMRLPNLADKPGWTAAGVRLPEYDAGAVARQTIAAPAWLHFGAGNLFRGYIAALMQRLLNQGACAQGIVAAETFDYDIVRLIYQPFDNLVLQVTLNENATMDAEILASVAQAIAANPQDPAAMARLFEIFSAPSLQMVSLTITEKGYAVLDAEGGLLPAAERDIQNPPEKAASAVGILTCGLHARYLSGAAPLALVSMDNCARNGERLEHAVLEMARRWLEKGAFDPGFWAYLSDPRKIAFPWTMIDKITPRPAEAVAFALSQKGIGEMRAITTQRSTYIAPFANAEAAEYLVVEDAFPNGRPPLERAGVYMAGRDTVSRAERMKVTACLNPLHTAMSLYGCLLGHTRIYEEMRDREILALITQLGYREGLPVVEDPGILSPRAFLDEVVSRRLPNPFLPDTPHRIATDTSQKMGIRFGETLKRHLHAQTAQNLVALPLSIAGWIRYLLGIDDTGRPMEIAPDPMLPELRAALSGISFGNPKSAEGKLAPFLANAQIFGLDISQTCLFPRIEGYVKELVEGPGAVRATLARHLPPPEKQPCHPPKKECTP